MVLNMDQAGPFKAKALVLTSNYDVKKGGKKTIALHVIIVTYEQKKKHLCLRGQ